MLLGGLVIKEASAPTRSSIRSILGAASIVASIVGTFFVKAVDGGKIMNALYKGVIVSGVISALVAFWFITKSMMGDRSSPSPLLPAATLIGLALTAALIVITEYYTATEYGPVRGVAAASQTGHGDQHHRRPRRQSMKSTALPVLAVCAAIYGATRSRVGRPGLYGIAIAATAMLSITGMIVALDAYGPITDNAGGIAEMVRASPEEGARHHRSARCGGQHHQGSDQGLCHRLRGLAALVLFADYTHNLERSWAAWSGFSLSDPAVIIGLFIGGLVPYLFGAMAMEAVGRAAGSVVVEVRRQFREIKGIMEGTAKPDYSKASTC